MKLIGVDVDGILFVIEHPGVTPVLLPELIRREQRHCRDWRERVQKLINSTPCHRKGQGLGSNWFSEKAWLRGLPLGAAQEGPFSTVLVLSKMQSADQGL